MWNCNYIPSGNTVASSYVLGFLDLKPFWTTRKCSYGLVISVQFYVVVLNFENKGACHFALVRAVELCFLCMSYCKISNKDQNPQELLLEILPSMTVIPKERNVKLYSSLTAVPAYKTWGSGWWALGTENFCCNVLPFSHQCQTKNFWVCGLAMQITVSMILMWRLLPQLATLRAI